MSAEAQQRFQIARLTAQVEQLQQALSNSTSEVDDQSESEQLKALKAEADHKCQKEKAIWAAIRAIAGEDAARRIEEEVSRRPIVAAPKSRRRGTVPNMPTPHLTVVTKTTAAPKWPPATPRESAATAPEVSAAAAPKWPPATPRESAATAPEVSAAVSKWPPSTPRESAATAPEVSAAAAPKWPPSTPRESAATAPDVPVTVVAAAIEADSTDEAKPKFEVDEGSVPPSVARQLFGGSKAIPTAAAVVSLPLKLDCTSSTKSSVAEVPSPMRRRESSTTLSGVPPRAHTSHGQPDQVRYKESATSMTPTAEARVLASATPQPPQVRLESSAAGNTTPVVSSVRDRIRQLELSARRSSLQN